MRAHITLEQAATSKVATHLAKVLSAPQQNMTPLPAALQSLLVSKYADKIDEGWSEDDGWKAKGLSHWVYLKKGWHNGAPGSHIIHEGTVAEVRQALRQVQPCTCPQCRSK